MMDYSVKLIGVTKPNFENTGCNTAEELVAYAARVSNPGNQANTSTAQKLLSYLMRNRHWSPFEMVSVVMEINTTRDIARQILRHRSFSFQEFSQRYASAEELGFTKAECRMQDPKNRQASNETDDEELKQRWVQVQDSVLSMARTAYAWALDNGLAKEQARKVLPEGLTNSRVYVAGPLRSWIHAIQVRDDEGVQKETRALFKQARQIINQEFPSITQLL
jgi:thymidylate synthase (FAD)